MICVQREHLGGYVLGAMDDDEREDFELHLETCDACRREYAELADLPALLDLAAPSAMPLPPVPSDAEERLVARLRGTAAPQRRSRRRRTVITVGVSALAGAAVAAVAFLAFGRGDDPVTPTIALTPASAAIASDAWATAKLHPRAAGTIVDFEAGNLPPTKDGERYVVVVREGGKQVAEAEFQVDDDGWAQVAITTVQKLYPDAELEVRRDEPGQPLVLRSPA